MRHPVVKAALALLPALLLPAAWPAAATEKELQPPNTQTAPGPRPDITVRELASRPVPNLAGKGEEAKKNALAFIDWAGSSTKDQDEVVRKTLAGVRENAEIVMAFCEEAFAAQDSDHSRALVTLSLIGETRSATGMECLAKFLRQPFPEKGTLVDGEILEQTALGTLQAKAIDGLAYLHEEKADQLVVEAAAKHPSRIVRAEAIAAYLWNHRYDARSREVLKSVVRKDELIFLDRLVKQAEEPKESFNRKLAAYLKSHPELMPPGPRKADAKPRTTVGQPPKF
ncbi:MAG TPA: hypothetical protein VF928_03440 [Usitatibacteraceae bacterium]